MASRANVELHVPEGVSLPVEPAAIWERVSALLVDLGLVSILTTVFALVARYADSTWVLGLIGLFVIRHGYFIFFELRWQGATPGKRVLGIRVVSTDGWPLAAEAIIARGLLRDVELLLPVVALVAPEEIVGTSPWWLRLLALGWVAVFVLIPFLNGRRARAGDLVAGTMVVRVPRAVLPSDAAKGDETEDLGFTAAELDIYGEHELETLAAILRDVGSPNLGEDDLAMVARTIATKIGRSHDEAASDPITFLRAFYRAQRTALERHMLFGRRKPSKYDEMAANSPS